MKVGRGSTLTFTRDLPNIVPILFASVKFTCVRTQKLHDSGADPKGVLHRESDCIIIIIIIIIIVISITIVIFCCCFQHCVLILRNFRQYITIYLPWLQDGIV